jgi:hypothetical protein
MREGITPGKVRYEVDPHNRLIAKRSGEESTLAKYREILEGRFSIGQGNSLTYHLKKASNFDLPQQIKLSGNWSLDKQHNLVLTLDKWNNQCQGDKLVISGDIISAQANELAFSVMTRDSPGQEHFYLMKFSGLWQADEYNRLTFNLVKENGPPEALTLEGAWEINRKNKLGYNYTKRGLKRKEHKSNTLTFEGYWDIIDKHRIAYIISRQLHWQFDLQVSFEKPLRNSLQYRIGVGVDAKEKTIKIFGNWKINKKLGVYFETEGGGQKSRAILLTASYKIGKGYGLEVRLRNSLNQDLGLEARLSKRFFDDQGEVFIRALASKREKAVSAGAGFRW